MMGGGGCARNLITSVLVVVVVMVVGRLYTTTATMATAIIFQPNHTAAAAVARVSMVVCRPPARPPAERNAPWPRPYGVRAREGQREVIDTHPAGRRRHRCRPSWNRCTRTAHSRTLTELGSGTRIRFNSEVVTYSLPQKKYIIIKKKNTNEYTYYDDIII